ncbi:winged helix-turn-helix domain-containing protein [Thalassotalea sp. G2M2-11]|uniref:winged helix-turn-helix domain-containing protein n=1 Tax=Thalassotalea sp. G2M2-11 TaxID=2787627 RepID=UPI0019D266AD|nr:winged helix-turn-helix domain-containing protein [Thalassotalea sp. G2M2-11]
MNFEHPFKIGNCQIIPMEYAIEFDHQEKQSIQPKFIDVICYLAQHYPRVVPREELIEQVWQGNAYVGEKALTNAIWHLRQHLKGCDEAQQDVIETIRKVGYRLLIKPENLQAVPEEKTENSPQYQRGILGSIIAVVFLAVVIFNFYGSELPPEKNQISQITTYPGIELFTAPSPDGKQVVFKWLSPQTSGNLYLKDLENPQLPPKQLTFGKAYVGHSVWSNDGRFLFFARKDRAKKSCQVIQLKMQTHQEKVVANCPLVGGYYYVDISPDDKTLAFHGYMSPAENSGVYFVDLTKDNSQAVRFSCQFDCGYKDRDFSFSPDGKTIAVTRRVNRFNENIFLVDLASKQATQLTFGEEDIVGLTWHPNGDKLVFGSQQADIRRGFSVDINSGKTQDLQLDGFSYPSFAKQSGQLFYQQRTEKYHLASLSLDSDIASTPFPIIVSKFSHQYPHYSPKSDKVAYVSNESGHYELWISDTDGKNRQQITDLQHNIRYPRWSHNGNKIAFLAPIEDEQGDKIYIYDLTTKTLSVVPSQHNEHNRPTWSWQDDAIISAVYEKEYTDLHLIDIKTGHSRRITYDGSRYGVMTSPTTLVYTQTQKGLWQKELSDDTSQPLAIISDQNFKATYSWEYHPEGVYFSQRHNKHYLISFYDFQQNITIPLHQVPRNLFNSQTSITKINKTNELLLTMAESPQADIRAIYHPMLP